MNFRYKDFDEFEERISELEQAVRRRPDLRFGRSRYYRGGNFGTNVKWCRHKPEMILFYRLSVVLNVVFLLAGLMKLLW